MAQQLFGFTDIQDSTQKWESTPRLMNLMLLKHDEIIRDCLQKWGGTAIKHTGDGVFFKFDNQNGFYFAVELQKCFNNEDWSAVGGLQIRVTLHAGEAIKRGDDYFGPVINRAARLLGLAQGGQVLCTAAALDFCTRPLYAPVKQLGRHRLKGVRRPLAVYELQHGYGRELAPAGHTRPFTPLTQFINSSKDAIRLAHTRTMHLFPQRQTAAF